VQLRTTYHLRCQALPRRSAIPTARELIDLWRRAGVTGLFCASSFFSAMIEVCRRSHANSQLRASALIAGWRGRIGSAGTMFRE